MPFLELMLARDMTVAAGDDPGAKTALLRVGRPLILTGTKTKKRLLVASGDELDELLGPGFSTSAALALVHQNLV